MKVADHKMSVVHMHVCVRCVCGHVVCVCDIQGYEHKCNTTGNIKVKIDIV